MSYFLEKRFRSYDQLQTDLEKYMKETNTVFRIRNSTKLPYAKCRRPIAPALKYLEVKFQCSYFGFKQSPDR